MADLPFLQATRDDAGDAAPSGKRRVGHDPHQPDAATTGDELDPARRELGSEFPCSGRVHGVNPRCRPTKHADASHPGQRSRRLSRIPALQRGMKEQDGLPIIPA